MLLSLVLGKQWGPFSDGRGGTITYYYSDEVTWIVVTLALGWLTWFLLSRYMRARALRRRPRPTDYGLKQVVRIKRELSSQYLRPGFSRPIHAVGIGRLPDNRYCIQIFLNDVNEELWTGAGAAPLPNSFRGVPLVPIEMPAAVFLSAAGLSPPSPPDQYPNGIRGRQEVIVGGISGANTNLAGQSGTIGYFCTRKSKFRRRKEIHLLSNSHVFADLQKATVDESDLIMQPSPGEPAGSRPIGMLVDFSRLTFEDQKAPNHIDVAIARLWGAERHDPVIPLIGAVNGYVATNDIEIGETVRKFGRTTGYSEGRVTSIYLDIWIQYDRTGRAACFSDQILIEPDQSRFTKFVAKGDSGSLLVDSAQHAVGLIFAGVSDAIMDQIDKSPARLKVEPGVDQPRRIDGYGVANPISDVLDRMNIELVLERPLTATSNTT
ncbi:MAG: hypothetical protein WAM70_20095 [Pyrinomonadaceae bacterium]